MSSLFLWWRKWKRYPLLQERKVGKRKIFARAKLQQGIFTAIIHVFSFSCLLIVSACSCIILSCSLVASPSYCIIVFCSLVTSPTSCIIFFCSLVVFTFFIYYLLLLVGSLHFFLYYFLLLVTCSCVISSFLLVISTWSCIIFSFPWVVSTCSCLLLIFSLYFLFVYLHFCSSIVYLCFFNVIYYVMYPGLETIRVTILEFNILYKTKAVSQYILMQSANVYFLQVLLLIERSVR